MQMSECMWGSYYQITLISPRRGLVPSANLPPPGRAVLCAPHETPPAVVIGAPAEGLTGAAAACRVQGAGSRVQGAGCRARQP